VVLLDVNVLVGAMRSDAPRHAIMRGALEALRASPEPFALCDPVLSGTLRILTHPRVFTPPTPMPDALHFVHVLRASPNALMLAPGPRHWALFVELLERAPAAGNLVSDAWIGALAMEHGCDVLSDDADFARLPGVRWRRP
jgi:toxin-antitoxin system PIN domain toxin